jgi:signal peptidase I
LRGGVGFVPAENLVGRAEVLFFSTPGTASFWEVWKWRPDLIRFSRFFTTVK